MNPHSATSQVSATRNINITVVGSGYVGLVAAACFAEVGHNVICVDSEERKIAALQSGATPIHEKYLPELIERHLNTRIHFTTDLSEGVRNSEAIFIAVGTPQSEAGEADLTYVEAVANEIAHSLNCYKVIVEKSTVPVYTNNWIRRTIERCGIRGNLFDVVSNPEFLREGTAVQDFLHPDRIVIGSCSDQAAAIMDAIYLPLTSGEYYSRPDAIPGPCSAVSCPTLLNTSTKSAEIIKHASNAFLAMKISFINAVSNLCEAAGADIEQVANGIGLDSRIGPRFLRPGIGYGGSCFPKDVAAFRSVAEHAGVDFNLLTEVERINAGQKERFLSKVRTALWNLRGKRLGILGLAFKGETDDIRDSPAIDLVKRLLAEGCSIRVFDPAAMTRAEEELPVTTHLSYAKDAYSVAVDVDALLVLTDWPEFASLDLRLLYSMMRHPMILDGRNMFDPRLMQEHGFTYISVGRPGVYPVLDVETNQELMSI